MNYRISYSNPHDHFITIECKAETLAGDTIDFQLPSWRPGRYELGNFARNVRKWKATDLQGNPLAFKKLSKDLWSVTCPGISHVLISYEYFASELNAGSTFLDETQLYMNPVNCCGYIQGRVDEPCEIDLHIPANYIYAGSLKKCAQTEGKQAGFKTVSLKAGDFHELADSPFIVSPTIQHDMFVLDGVEFNLWFQGECKPMWTKIINDFFIFINEQFLMMKEFVHDEYHFLYQILPYKFYHGVEHLHSTVIALGPGYRLNEGDLFDDLLGVSSHELYHAWNIKSIRPAEMLPYDYTRENYSRLGYVCEGVTTYYGDLFLFRSGVYSEFDYIKTVHERLQKHFDNPGRFNLSVADSSFDTWLDGYTPGIPGRKTSIYDEGCLAAFMTDIIIRRNTGNEKSLDDVMRILYHDYAKKGKGYTEQEYQQIVETLAGEKLDDFFNTYIYGAASYEKKFSELGAYIGIELKNVGSKKHYEGHFGFKAHHEGHHFKVSAVYPGSPADKSGLVAMDEILALNGYMLKDDLHEWCRHFKGQEIRLSISRNGRLSELVLHPGADTYYRIYYIQKMRHASDTQKAAFAAWSRRKF
ncbi:MAG: M61 family metallopeptidase [Bacteroidia bacterium]